MKATNSPAVMSAISAGDMASHTSTARARATSSWITGVLTALVSASFMLCWRLYSLAAAKRAFS